MTDDPQSNDDTVRRDFITAYAEKWHTTQAYAADMLEHVEIGAVEGALQPLYKKLCGMHTEMLLIHGPGVAQGLAVAIKEIHALLPEETTP